MHPPELAQLDVEAPSAIPTRVRSACLAGLGHALPGRVVSNAEIAERIGVEPSWIERRTGIRERRSAADAEQLSDLATSAALAALQDAAIDPQQVDLVLVATITPDAAMPNAAPLVAHGIGASGAGACDLGAACSGFVSALALGGAMIEAERADTVLVVGADVMSRLINYDDRRTAGLFGDGAGAAVLTASRGGALGPTLLGSDGSRAPLIVAPRETGLIEMAGHETFLAAVAILTESTLTVCERAGIEPHEVDLFVYHQANGRILRAVAERLDLPSNRVVDCIDRFGNTSAATIPLALSLSAQEGRLPREGTVLLAAVGAGMAWGAALLDYAEAA